MNYEIDKQRSKKSIRNPEDKPFLAKFIKEHKYTIMEDIWLARAFQEDGHNVAIVDKEYDGSNKEYLI